MRSGAIDAARAPGGHGHHDTPPRTRIRLRRASPGPGAHARELAAELGVSVQALYDLRSQGRGPRGFRVGRVLKFRVSEVEAWLAQLEADDAARHPHPAR